MDDLDERIAEANDEFISEEEEVVEKPQDLYQNQIAEQKADNLKSYPYGARTLVLSTTKDILDKGKLSEEYRLAKEESENLYKNGDRYRGNLVRQTYMYEKFLPAIEVVVNYTSPDELLNNNQALKLLDDLALGIGKMAGFTSAYVRKAYGNSLGMVSSSSSPEVSSTMRKLNGYLNTGQVSVARGCARKLLEKIRAGRTIATTADYQTLMRLAKV